MKIVLGTVQFGCKYGIANQTGKVNYQEIIDILSCAEKEKISMLDTAINYGDSETCLGKIGVRNWDVITKISVIPVEVDDVGVWLEQEVKGSLRRLDINSLYGLLLHRPEQLLSKKGEKLYQSLIQLKNEGICKKIGISVYSPQELDSLLPYYDLDIVQAPFNILDNRIYSSGWMKKLSDTRTELHVRSIFLQGLLLLSLKKRPDKFSKWSDIWRELHNWLIDVELTPLQACVRYVLSFGFIDKILVGVDNVKQLIEIKSAMKEGALPTLPTISCNDINLIDPSKWNAL